MTFHRADTERFERRLHVFEHSEPREERETLEDDGDVRGLSCKRFAVPKNLA